MFLPLANCEFESVRSYQIKADGKWKFTVWVSVQYGSVVMEIKLGVTRLQELASNLSWRQIDTPGLPWQEHCNVYRTVQTYDRYTRNIIAFP
jgi:hypothetical protein